MGVARQPAAEDLAAEPVEVVLGETAFEVGAGVDPRRGVALQEELVAGATVALAAEEVVEADVVERGRRRERREVTAEPVEAVVGAVDHRHRVPADRGADAALELLVAGEPLLVLGRDRVDVVGRDHRRHADALLTRPLHEARQEIAGAGPAPFVDHRVERVEPLRGLARVDVGQLMDEAVDEHCAPGYARSPPLRNAHGYWRVTSRPEWAAVASG